MIVTPGPVLLNALALVLQLVVLALVGRVVWALLVPAPAVALRAAFRAVLGGLAGYLAWYVVARSEALLDWWPGVPLMETLFRWGWVPHVVLIAALAWALVRLSRAEPPGKE